MTDADIENGIEVRDDAMLVVAMTAAELHCAARRERANGTNGVPSASEEAALTSALAGGRVLTSTRPRLRRS